MAHNNKKVKQFLHARAIACDSHFLVDSWSFDDKNCSIHELISDQRGKSDYNGLGTRLRRTRLKPNLVPMSFQVVYDVIDDLFIVART